MSQGNPMNWLKDLRTYTKPLVGFGAMIVSLGSDGHESGPPANGRALHGMSK
jgi:hypothetical protein